MWSRLFDNEFGKSDESEILPEQPISQTPPLMPSKPEKDKDVDDQTQAINVEDEAIKIAATVYNKKQKVKIRKF